LRFWPISQRRTSVKRKISRRVHPDVAADPTPATVEAAVEEMESLYDAAGLVRSLPDTTAPAEVAVDIRSLLQSGRYRLLGP
jgi:hypothetical protein